MRYGSATHSAARYRSLLAARGVLAVLLATWLAAAASAQSTDFYENLDGESLLEEDAAGDDVIEVWPASTQPAPMSQGGAAAQPQRQTTPPPATRRTTRTYQFGDFLRSSRRSQLASVPDMLGNFYHGSGRLQASDILANGGSVIVSADVPLAAGTRRTLIGENNKALPVDRVYFNYNHFHNAHDSKAATFTFIPITVVEASRSSSVDQYTFGFEKTFLDGHTSVELRVPMAGRTSFDFEDPAEYNSEVHVRGGNFGNLAVVVKQLLYSDCVMAISGGLGVTTPTGTDARVIAAFTQYTIENEAVFLHPFLGMQRQFGEMFFAHLFTEFDISLNGNTVEFESIEPDSPVDGSYGKYDDATLWKLNLSTGCWLHRGECGALLSGLAGLVELHYTTTIEDGDLVLGTRPSFFFAQGKATLAYGNPHNRQDALNLTTGLHFEFWENTTARIAGSFPLRDDGDQFYDAEVFIQASRRF